MQLSSNCSKLLIAGVSKQVEMLWEVVVVVEVLKNCVLRGFQNNVGCCERVQLLSNCSKLLIGGAAKQLELL